LFSAEITPPMAPELGAATVDAGKDGFAVHADGFKTASDSYAIPGGIQLDGRVSGGDLPGIAVRRDVGRHPVVLGRDHAADGVDAGKDGFAVHADGFKTASDSYAIPGGIQRNSYNPAGRCRRSSIRW
jgi:hypothetical protein